MFGRELSMNELIPFHYISTLSLLLSLSSTISLIVGVVHNQASNPVGKNEEVKEGDEWSMEVDLRSREKEKRTLHFFVRGIQQRVFITGVPDRVEFGV